MLYIIGRRFLSREARTTSKDGRREYILKCVLLALIESLCVVFKLVLHLPMLHCIVVWLVIGVSDSVVLVNDRQVQMWGCRLHGQGPLHTNMRWKMLLVQLCFGACSQLGIGIYVCLMITNTG